jgi:GTPase SAR1 family protein
MLSDFSARHSLRIGFLSAEESHATRVPWWPIIAVLGVYSSGKSTFINHYLGYELQRTGNQAVDDKFTVICFSRENTVRTLPGLALDADPRFPFYQMSRALEEITTGEGRRIDAYLQLKTCPSERVRGKILIDSPGFDADAQRTSTLRITRHIIDLSDLVLVLFDARHPEPGTMHDTLEHLVSDTIHRPDSSKFLYVLNQVDTTAREDNPEDVAASWQRALAQKGLTAGRFTASTIQRRPCPLQTTIFALALKQNGMRT